MNQIEYDIIDELYFVTSFKDIARAVTITEEELVSYLQSLVQRDYVKAFFPDPDTEVVFPENQPVSNIKDYFFLATKAGLIAHNSL